ncbi:MULTISPECIES: MOSC N-terminal beta barrel domain-containing protein [unclassified Caballeronia]|uniref:MOSC domain-containing protein n=1 Tax=unclassified Caballeronia TaxID=2646786 RepID=UPI002864C5DC|nr:MULTISPECIES: MOSC N-terminal beta barrel domain-containing protein [unclassified Caballeronia]MDR5736524.1 MOSC N-terminal beta barrel domain-containing protein [Caballeronia sp. LZ016]MDR5810997.1 MOSC N-terminal beta barrel domain-containing protein [Caballeronia sp. LZ019]
MPVINELFVYPIKSCAGIAVQRATLLETGLEYDRNWMVTDASGGMITQRTHPRMALITTAIDGEYLRIGAPGMPTLRTPLDARALSGADRMKATVWRDTVEALDTGRESSQWFGDFLGVPAKLARFAPEARRAVDEKWTAPLSAETRFADGFPLLVLGQASLDDLNARLAGNGAPAVSADRFRPNVVVGGLDAFEEDYVGDMTIRATNGDVRLRLVKLCTRCPVPTIDQLTGAPNPAWPHEPLDTMSTFRASEQHGGKLTFGKNAIVVDGGGIVLEAGQAVDAEIAF